MTRPELDRMLEKAVAEAIGVPYRNKSVRRPETAFRACAAATQQRRIAARLIAFRLLPARLLNRELARGKCCSPNRPIWRAIAR